jgi:uncharacterized OB-fold protein
MKATIYTYTVIRSSTIDFKDKTPYVAGIVESEEGKIAALIEGYQEGMPISIGQTVVFSHLDAKGNKVFRFE